MKKLLLSLLLAVWVLTLSACASLTDEEKLIQTVWEGLDLSAKPQYVYIMEYTNRTHLSDESIETGIYDRIPTSGYAIIFSTPANVSGFHGMHVVFADEEGGILFDFDYADHYEKYESIMPASFSIYNTNSITWATTCLEECNYFSGMYLYAWDEVDKTRQEALCTQTNAWYKLDEERLDRMFK